MEQPSYYAILTADVRYNKNLSSSQKLFFAEITALTQKTGKCWASNKYFAELYDVAKSTISSWVSALEDEGLINVDYQREGKQIKQRTITLAHIAEGIQKSEQGYSENKERVFRKSEQGYSENPKENNTSKSNNTRVNNTRELKTLSRSELDTKLEKITLTCYQDIKEFNPHADSLEGATIEDWLKPLQSLLDQKELDELRLFQVWDHCYNQRKRTYWKKQLKSTEDFKANFGEIYKDWKAEVEEEKADLCDDGYSKTRDGNRSNKNTSRSRTDEYFDHNQEVINQFQPENETTYENDILG